MTYDPHYNQEYNDDVRIPTNLNILVGLQGMITTGEGLRLTYLASKVPKNRAIVEIGSFKGKSTCFLASGSKMGYNPVVYTIDPWETKAHYPTAEKPYHLKENFEIFREQINIAGVEGEIKPIKGLSTEVAKNWSQRVGLLYIDGEHTYESVKADFLSWSKFLGPNSIIAFHDYGGSKYGVTRFVEELKTKQQFKKWRVYHRLASGYKRKK